MFFDFKKRINSLDESINLTDNEAWDLFISLGGIGIAPTKEMADAIRKVLEFKI